MPVISKITGAPFRFWCQKILPAVYDDSLSYYELLCKVVDYLNKVMEDDINVVNLVNQLEEFVNDYFTNLDVQNEINNKLDAMAEDGSLLAVVAPHLDPIIEDYKATLDADLAEYKDTMDADVAYFKSTVNDAIDAQDTDIANFKNTVNGQVSAQNTEISNFKTSVNAQITTQNANINQQDSDITVMQSQLSNFLSSATPDANAELLDIRVGADGITYNTAGDAVRGQYSDLKTELGYTYSPYTDIFLMTGYIATDQGVGNAVDYTINANSSWECCVVNCKKGDKFDINATGGTAPKAWCFVDESDVIVSVATENDCVLTLTAPADGKFIYNSSKANETRHCKYAKGARTSIDENSEVLFSQQNFVPFNFYETMEKDHVIFTGSPAIGGTVNMNSQFRPLGIGNIIIPCNAGDKFEIRGKVTSTTGNFRLWCFVDSSDAIISRSAVTVTDTTESPIVITAPDNAARLVCNMDYEDGYYVVKLYDYEKQIKSEIVKQYDINPYLTYDYSNEIISGKAVTIGSIGTEVSSPFNSNAYSLYDIDCAEGDTFELWVYNTTGTLSTWAFVDNNGVILSKAQNTSFGNDISLIKKRITAPENAVKLYVNVRTSDNPNNYVIRLGSYAENQPTAVNDDLQEFKYVMPEWSEVFPFVEKTYSHTQDFVDFNTLYQAFHALNTDGLIEEINMSTDYLNAVSDALPSYMTGIANGGMYMWHVIEPATDGSTFYQKHKRLKVMVFAGTHGSEKKSIWDLYYMLKDIKDNSSERAIMILRNFVDLYVCPLGSPYAIEQNTRNTNNINMNRDFWNPHWVKTADSGNTYNMLYETRCISWWIEQLSPDLTIDHHTSTGDNSFENGKFLMWGVSAIPAVNSLIEQVIMEMSPLIRKQYPDIFGNYDWVYGHTQNIETYMGYGTLPLFAYFKTKSVSMTFEVVLSVKWDGVQVITSSDADHTALMTIDYCDWMNMLMAILKKTVNIKNGALRID